MPIKHALCMISVLNLECNYIDGETILWDVDKLKQHVSNFTKSKNITENNYRAVNSAIVVWIDRIMDALTN